MSKERSRFRLLLAALIMATAFMAVAMPSITGKSGIVQAAETPGWHGTGATCYYVNTNGTRAKTGWLRLSGKYYYIKKDGYRALGQYKVGTRYYYFNKYNGERMTGWRKIGTGYYYFHTSQGYRMTGWLKTGGHTFYLNPKKYGRCEKGWETIAGNRYYFNAKGYMHRGWLKFNGKLYFANVQGRMVKGWELIGARKFFFNDKYQYVKQTTNMNTGLQKSTLLTFLKTAVQPAGKCMYVWGGGWNEADNGAGVEALTIGMSRTWQTFADAQGSSYDYNTTRYQIHKGLDCSGFVGWAIYNTFQTKNNQDGFVMLADKMAKNFSSRGWGAYSAAGSFEDYRAGDIMSSSGHVYIVIGQCSDGSVVLLHASPPGVMLSGTCTRSGSYNSEAIKLANAYMKKYRPSWYAKFPNSSRGTSYLTSFSRMRWYLGASKMMTDPDGLAKMDAAGVLKAIFGA